MFPSDQIEFAYVNAIQSKCEVINYSEYEQINSHSDGIYFTRAKFNRKIEKLEPGPDEWKKSCHCNMPVNPDLEYILCSRCDEWFHLSCVKLKKKFSMDE